MYYIQQSIGDTVFVFDSMSGEIIKGKVTEIRINHVEALLYKVELGNGIRSRDLFPAHRIFPNKRKAKRQLLEMANLRNKNTIESD